MENILINNKKKFIVFSVILILIVSVNLGYSQWSKYKYSTGFGLTNTEKYQNIKIAVLGKQYDKALRLCNNYYEDNDSIRLQWRNKIEKCKNEGLTPYNVADLDDIY